MPTITVSDVRAGFQTSLPDSEVELAIAIVDGADACLNANYSADTAKALKLYGARHILAMQSNSGQGQAVSERAVSGAARTFATQGEGLSSTHYGTLLRQLDVSGCITGLLEATHKLSIMSVGPR
jgi:hypothetical protein